MKAEVVTIGDEILIGQITDTNSAWISARLNEIGVTVGRKLTVGDEREEILRSIGEAMEECDVVVITGGLGPTKDDITKLTLAEYFDCGMVRDEGTYRRNEATLTARGVAYNDLNRAQAMVPECCTVLPNHNGTAPGMWFERDGKVLVSLPGVPFEMKALVTEEMLPRIKEHFSLRSVIHRTAVTFGLAESVLAQTIEGWEDTLPRWLRLAYLPSPSQIRLRLSAYDVDCAAAEAEMERQFAALEKIIPEYIVGYGEETVASAAARLLQERGATLAAAESCTGGALSARFTAMSGASEYFLGSVVSYSNDVKADVLGASRDDLAAHGAVSRQVAEQMAAGARRLCGSDYAISTTGIAGPSGGTPENPVGTVWIAVATPGGIHSRRFVFGNLRAQNIDRASATAINMLRLLLTGQAGAFINEGIL